MNNVITPIPGAYGFVDISSTFYFYLYLYLLR
uniref:Uncharacterized protein n=1 Tax=Myoviridae sp. ctCo31 TaxID=2825053 RepID=A0A8S5UM07_9CAUD|nr:MAG TPA: hypothetical protein [Myoviridae sp. ctCo31]